MAYRGADPTDVMGRRIGAYLLDGLIAAIVGGALFVALFLPTFHEAPRGSVVCPGDPGASTSGVQPKIAFCSDRNADTVRYLDQDQLKELYLDLTATSIGLGLLNHVVIQGVIGGSLGKLALGLRVVRADGADAGPGRCLVRYVLIIVDSFCCAIVGLLTAFRSRGHRRVGDMVAGTMVISRKDQDALIIARSGLALPDRTSLAADAWVPPSAATTAAWGADGQPGTTATTTAAPQPGIDGPSWDASRGTYIQYDHDLVAWMQWDEASRSWQPIR